MGTAAGGKTMMKSGREIELKLSVRPDDLARVAQSSCLRPPGARRAFTRNLKSVYYDTPDFALRAHDLVLRVRQTGQRYVQTVKTRPVAGNGVMNRGEWEAKLSGPAPDLARIAAADMRETLDDAAGKLAPVFTTLIRRTTRRIERGNEASVEVVVDRGELVSQRGSEAVYEIELELKQGRPAALFDFALALNEVAPVHLETRSKSDRGYALLMGAAFAWSKSGALILDPAMSGAEAFEIIVRHNLAHLLANEAAARDGRDPEGVHQMRLALRRLRSALTVFAPLLPADLLHHIKQELRWLASELGPARDLDVFGAELLGPVRAAFAEDSDLAVLEAATQDMRREAYERVRAAFATTRFTGLLLRLGRLTEASAWQEQLDLDQAVQLAAPVRNFACDLLTRRHDKARKRGRGFGKLSGEDRHALRLALKRLRYAGEFFRSLYDKGATAPYLKRLSRLQDTLGHLNDVETATRLLEQVQERAKHAGTEKLHRAAGLVIGWHRRGAANLEPKLRRQWRAFKSEAPFWADDPA